MHDVESRTPRTEVLRGSPPSSSLLNRNAPIGPCAAKCAHHSNRHRRSQPLRQPGGRLVSFDHPLLRSDAARIEEHLLRLSVEDRSRGSQRAWCPTRRFVATLPRSRSSAIWCCGLSVSAAACLDWLTGAYHRWWQLAYRGRSAPWDPHWSPWLHRPRTSPKHRSARPRRVQKAFDALRWATPLAPWIKRPSSTMRFVRWSRVGRSAGMPVRVVGVRCCGRDSNDPRSGQRATPMGQRLRAIEGRLRVASGHSTHTSARPLHLALLSLRIERRVCNHKLPIRRDRCQASRGHELSLTEVSFRTARLAESKAAELSSPRHTIRLFRASGYSCGCFMSRCEN